MMESNILFDTSVRSWIYRRYCTVEKEVMGLILAQRAFSVYFGSTEVRVDAASVSIIKCVIKCVTCYSKT